MKQRDGQAMLMAMLLACGTGAVAQELNTKFSCSETRNESGEKVIYADNGEIRLRGVRIEAFQWESALYRSTHGFDCSIEQGDGLEAEMLEGASKPSWLVALTDARAARDRRGYDFDRGLNCFIRLKQDGDTLQIKPACPALCGSRTDFSALSVNLKTGDCRYEQ